MKEKIAIVADSCADLPSTLATEMGITVVPLQVIFGDKNYRDGIDIMPEQFYQMLSEANELPTTAQPSPQVFMEVYQTLLNEHDKVISIHLSEKLSGTLQSAKIAADEFNGKVVVWDTKSISVGVALQVYAAAEAVLKGMQSSEILALLNKVRETTTTIFTLDTLEYLQKGGRIGKAASLLGSVLNIKPIINVAEGYYHAFGRARSQKKALKSIINHLTAIGEKHKVVRLAIGHGMADDAAEILREGLEKAFGLKSIMISQVGPVIGVHTGPGAVGAAIAYY